MLRPIHMAFQNPRKPLALTGGLLATALVAGCADNGIGTSDYRTVNAIHASRQSHTTEMFSGGFGHARPRRQGPIDADALR